MDRKYHQCKSDCQGHDEVRESFQENGFTMRWHLPLPQGCSAVPACQHNMEEEMDQVRQKGKKNQGMYAAVFVFVCNAKCDKMMLITFSPFLCHPS